MAEQQRRSLEDLDLGHVFTPRGYDDDGFPGRDAFEALDVPALVVSSGPTAAAAAFVRSVLRPLGFSESEADFVLWQALAALGPPTPENSDDARGVFLSELRSQSRIFDAAARRIRDAHRVAAEVIAALRCAHDGLQRLMLGADDRFEAELALIRVEQLIGPVAAATATPGAPRKIRHDAVRRHAAAVFAMLDTAESPLARREVYKLISEAPTAWAPPALSEAQVNAFRKSWRAVVPDLIAAGWEVFGDDLDLEELRLRLPVDDGPHGAA